MKTFLSLLMSLTGVFVFAQNTVPIVEILSVEADEELQLLTLTYQLEDAENDLCEVWVKFSVDGGTYFEMVPLSALSGSVGEGIVPSSDLSLSWDYSSLSGAIADVRLAVYASDNGEVDIADMVAQVDQSLLLQYLEEIEGERHYEAAPGHLGEVRNILTEAFSSAGLQTEGHDFIFDATDMRNIIGRQPGAKDESITFIIDGHFDGVPGSPGADDNGSAVAGVLEALRILSQYNFEHSLRFIGFDAEELGLIGSQRYVQNGIENFEDIQGVLNFEMIGYYSDEPNSQLLPEGFGLLFPQAVQEIQNDEHRGNFITVVGNVASNPLIETYLEAAEEYVPELRTISVAVPGNGAIAPDLRRSDHSRFWDAGYRALMLTDGSEFRNFNYHTPNDVIATLNFEFMANVVKATVAAAAELAIPLSVSSDQVDLSVLLSTEHHHDFPGKVQLFPNPSNGMFTIEVSEAIEKFNTRMEIYDLSGKAVYKEVLTFESGTSTAGVDLRSLAKGSYIMLLHSGDTSVSRGIVIER